MDIGFCVIYFLKNMCFSFGMKTELCQGYLLGDYVLEELLRDGEYSSVWRARPLEEEGVVALKVLQSRDQARFRSEAESLSRLRHQNIVWLIRSDLENNPPYHVLEYVSCSLESRKLGFLGDWRATAVLGVKLAQGLSYAHEQGVVHRDFSFTNILLKGDEPVICDFDLPDVEISSVVQSAGSSHRWYGTFDHIALEQYRTGYGSPKADVYSLASVLYNLVTGESPKWSRPSLDRIARAPPWFSRAVERCLSVRPENRYDAGQLALVLDKGLAQSRHPQTLWERFGLVVDRFLGFFSRSKNY